MNVKPPYILFADDDDDTLRLLEFMAQRKGWRYATARTAREILDRVNALCDEHECFDVIVADINYFDSDPDSGPRLTGITAALEIRKTHPNIPIVFISAYANGIIREQVREVNGEIMPKPFDIDILFRRLEFLVSWVRVTRNKECDGPDRRRNSVNFSDNQRRKTDAHLSIPAILQNMMNEIRGNKAAGGSK